MWIMCAHVCLHFHYIYIETCALALVGWHIALIIHGIRGIHMSAAARAANLVRPQLPARAFVHHHHYCARTLCARCKRLRRAGLVPAQYYG